MTLKVEVHAPGASTPTNCPAAAPSSRAPTPTTSQRNTVHRNSRGEIIGVTIRVLSPVVCEARITAVQQFFDQNYRFWFHHRALLAEALQPVINEDIAISGDRAQGLMIAAEMRRLQKLNDTRNVTALQQEQGQYTYADRNQHDGQLTRHNHNHNHSHCHYQNEQHQRHPSKSFYQNSVNSVVASNKHLAAMCIKYDLYQFMFICGTDADDGSRYKIYDDKKLADYMEALMGVIYEGGEGYNSEYAYEHWEWEATVRRWMASFEVDWEAAKWY